MTDSDGSFEFRPMLPGEYGLHVAAGEPEVEYRKPEVAQRLSASAQTVVVNARQVTTVRLEAPAQ